MAKLKLNDKLQQEICNNISHGIPYERSAILVGISESTFYSWYNKGKYSKTKEGKFYNFYLAIEDAKSKAIALRIEHIRKAGEEGTWQADAWWLERADRENFGLKQEVNVQADVNTTFKNKNKKLDDILVACEESENSYNDNDSD
jgi:hypothetical protein